MQTGTPGPCPLQVKPGRLAQEGLGIVEGDLGDGVLVMLASFHLLHAFRDGERVGHPPVTGGIHPDAFRSEGFENIDGAGETALGFRIESHAGPESGVEDHSGGVFLDVINDNTAGSDPGILEGVDGQAGPLELVLEVGGVDEDREIVLEGEVNVLLKDGQLVPGVLVEADFADAEDGGFVEKVGDDRHDFAGKDGVIRLLRVDAQPTKMRDSIFGGPLGFVFGELAVVIVKALRRGPVVAGPKGGLANGSAAGHGHGLVVGGGATNHVRVGLNVVHRREG